MFGAGTRKTVLVAILVLLTFILCSCDQMITAELPLAKRLKDDVTDALDSMAGNEVLLYEFTIDRRDYRQDDGRLDYDCTVDFAWDEFNPEYHNQVFVHYALVDGVWVLTSIDSDIEPAQLEERVVMYEMFTDTVNIPDIVRDALGGADTELSQHLLDFTAELSGAVYQFPCNFTDFTLNGWEIAAETGLDALRTILPQSYISLDMVNEDEKLSLYINNPTEDTFYIGQGECIGFELRTGDGSAALPLGITGQSTLDEVLAAYGDPFMDEDTKDGRLLTYLAAANSGVSFRFAADGTQLDLITMQVQDEVFQAAALFETYAFGFFLDGVDYELPIRLDTLLNNGWVISGTAQSDDVIHWYETKMLTLNKDEASVDVVVRNPSMGDMRLHAATVTAVTLDIGRAAFALVGTDNEGNRVELGLVIPPEGIFAVLGEPSFTETTGDTQIVTYSAGNGQYLRLTLGDGVAIAELQALETDETNTEALEAFALNVNISGNAFALPIPAVDFQDKVWVPDSGWTQPIKAGSFVEMFMENRRTEGLTAYFVNTGAETAALEDCTIAGLYAGPDYANMIVGRSLEVGSPASDAFSIFGTPSYDLQDTDARYLVYGTSVNRFLCVRCVEDFVDSLWVVCFTYP